MPQGAKGASPERGAAAPMNAPQAHFRSVASATPRLFRTLVARSATPERHVVSPGRAKRDSGATPERHEVRLGTQQNPHDLPVMQEPR